MNSKMLTAGAVLVGVLFIALAVYYWVTPAGALPSYIPGHSDGSATIHVKHGIAALLLGLASLAFAWFKSGPRTQAI